MGGKKKNVLHAAATSALIGQFENALSKAKISREAAHLQLFLAGGSVVKKSQTSQVWCLDYSFFIVAMTGWRQKMHSGEGMSLYPFTTTERTDSVTWFSLKKEDVLCSAVHMCRLLVHNLIRISQHQVDMAVNAKIRKYKC